jgi:ABC-type phosphate transport system substrate-binding protein
MIRLTKRRARSRGRRRGASFACLALLAAAFGVVNVGSASALGEQCSGSKARGLGAFLQTHAQERWASSNEAGFNGSSNPLACSGSQGTGGTPSVSYVPVSSTAALRVWGAEDGSLHEEAFGFQSHFLGTDIAPTGPVGEEGTMLSKMKAALGSDIAVVPVTQTAIAIAANPPALPAHPACAVPRISATQLQKVFSGEIKNWRQLGAASDSTLGGNCDQAITRIVRDESAGSTYQFKHYLDSVNPAALPCTGKVKRTWAQLQAPFGGESSPNVEWPRNPDCQEGDGPVTTVAGPGGEGELGPLAYVAQHPGTITYGSLPEAEQWAPKQIIDVHNGVKFASPSTNEGEANCGAAKYTRPTGWASGVNVDWSQVYGSDPNIGATAKNAYPICTLSWDIAAADHFTEKAATTVHDYLAFVVDKEGGQAAARHAGYRDLPSSIAKAAEAAIAHINGEEEGEGEEEEGGTGTVLCQAEPELVEGVLDCPKGQGFSGKVTGTLMPETVATFESASGPEVTVSCPQGEYFGEFNEDGSSAGNGISSFEFGLKEGCTTTFPEGPEAVVSFENPPFDASAFVYTSQLGPQGFFTLAKASKGQPLLRIQSGPVCVYAPGGVFESQITNGSPTEMFVLSKWKLVEEAPEGACPTVLVSSAHLTVSRMGEGLPLYIAGKSPRIEGGGRATPRPPLQARPDGCWEARPVRRPSAPRPNRSRRCACSCPAPSARRRAPSRRAGGGEGRRGRGRD